MTGGGRIDMTGIPLPASANEITAEWMQRALMAGGACSSAEIDALEIEALSEVTNAFGSLFRCRLTSRGGPADPASLIVKMPTSDALAFRMAKWLSLHRREVVYYRDIAPLGDLRSPALLYGDFDAHSHRFVLVLEDLGSMQSVPQRESVGELRARRAIRGIARLHGRFWEAREEPALAACGAFLTAGESRIMQTIYLLTLPAALERFGDLFSTAARRTADAFGTRITTHFAALAEGPTTLVHGDYRGDNLLFGGPGEDGLAALDWQGCGVGCGLHDVAFFLATSVSIDERRRIERDAVDEYHDTVCRLGAAKAFTREDCWRSYRQNILGALMPMVIGSGAIKMGDETIRNQTRVLLRRTVTAIEDLAAWEFLPEREKALSSGGAFSILSRCAFKAYAFALEKRKRIDG